MVKVKFFGSARIKYGVKEVNTEANDVKQLTERLAEQFEIQPKEIRNYLIFVNDVNITEIKMFKTKLKDGDTVMLMSPVSGG